MKFGQSIECNMRNNFLEKLYTKCGGETIPRPFSKNRNWAYLWINCVTLYAVFFIVCQVEGYKNILKLSSKQLAFTSYKDFLKNKRRSGTSFPASFPAWFLKKFISLAICYSLTKFHCLLAFTSWDIGQYVYCNCLLVRLWRHKFWNQSYLSSQDVFPTWLKFWDKNLNILRMKRAFEMK